MKSLFRYIAIAAVLGAALGLSSVPAKAQSLGDVLDFMSESATNVEVATSGSSCAYTRGVSNIACQIRSARYRAYHAQQITNRIEQQREAARRRQAAARGEIYNASTSQIQSCSWGMTEYCRLLGISQQQAVRALSDREMNFNGRSHPAATAQTSGVPIDLSHASQQVIQLCAWGDGEYCRILGATRVQAEAALSGTQIHFTTPAHSAAAGTWGTVSQLRSCSQGKSSSCPQNVTPARAAAILRAHAAQNR